MYPMQMAKEECSNLRPDGRCVGMMINDDLSIEDFRDEGLPCVLAERKQCEYFNECVLPMVDHIRDPKKAKSYLQAQRLYLKFEPLPAKEGDTPAEKIRICPDCKKNPCPKFKSRCVVCAGKRAKAKARDRQNRARRK